jgi:RND family efflux transporter MFP subunit
MSDLDGVKPAALKARRLRKLVPFVMIGAVATMVTVSRIRPAPVTVAPVVRGTAVDAVYATGTVEAEERVEVKAKTNGTVAELLVIVKVGARVKRGDVVARLDNPVLEADLARVRADLAAASAQAGSDAPRVTSLRAQRASLEADRDEARKELARAEHLAAGDAIPGAELDRARARVAQIDGAIAANEAEERATRIDLGANTARQAASVRAFASKASDAVVRAPIDGVILARHVDLGEVVSTNQPLFKIGDTTSLILEVAVDEGDVVRVGDGADGRPASAAAVSLFAMPGAVFRGHVFEVLPDASRERKSFVVKVRFDDPPRGLRSGMSAEVNVIAEERPGVLLAPAEAIDDGAIWIVRDDRAHRVPVHTGLRDLLRVEITDGAAREGDAVVVSAKDTLKDGARVRSSARASDPTEPMPDPSQPKTAAK